MWHRCERYVIIQHTRCSSNAITINHWQQQVLLSILATSVCPHSSHREDFDLTIDFSGLLIFLHGTKSNSKRRKQSAWLSAKKTSATTWKAFRRATLSALSTTSKMWERFKDKLSVCDDKYLVLFFVNCDVCTKGGRGWWWREKNYRHSANSTLRLNWGAGRSLIVGRIFLLFLQWTQCTLAASADIGNKLKWIRSALTTFPFHLRTPGPVSFLPYWAMIGWSHWAQPIINHCRLQVPEVFFPPLLLISLSRATAMMDITVGMFFISSGAGNGLGPPPHSGIKTKAKIKNVLAAKLQRERTWAEIV